MPGYTVLVPYGRKLVSYPASGHPHYTRDEAIKLLQRFHKRALEAGSPYTEDDPRIPYAEGPSERINLFWLENGKYLPSTLRDTNWYVAMNRWSDQTGIAHLLNPHSSEATPWCGAKVYALGGGFPSAQDAGVHECRRCRRLLDQHTKGTAS